MDQALLKKLETNSLKCSKCEKVIPFTFKSGNEYTAPSFTVLDEAATCYRCYHSREFEMIVKKKK